MMGTQKVMRYCVAHGNIEKEIKDGAGKVI